MKNKSGDGKIVESSLMNWYMVDEFRQKQMDDVMELAKKTMADYPNGEITYFWRGRTYYIALWKEPNILIKLLSYTSESPELGRIKKHQVEGGWMEKLACSIECHEEQNPYLGELLYKDIIGENQK